MVVQEVRRALLLPLITLCACAMPRVPDSTSAATLPRRIVLVATWSRCDDQREDTRLKAFLEDEMEKTTTRLRKLAVDAEVLQLWNPKIQTLRATLQRDSRPLWFVYSGHGVQEDAGSVLCLADGRWPEAEVIASSPEGQGYATYLFNACQSSYLDLRRGNTVVISTGPETIGNDDRHERTVVGGDLLSMLEQKLDTNDDGLVDSRELFAALDRAYTGEQPVQLKMQAQSWGPLPLFSRKADPQAAVIASAHLPIDDPPAFWSIPQELDGLQTRRDSIRKLLPPSTADVAAKDVQGPRRFQVARANGSLVVRDLGLRQVIWRKPLLEGTEPHFTDEDLDDFFHGFESLEQGRRRRYLRPISTRQRDDLSTHGFRAAICSEPTGQCFRQGGP